MSCGKTLGKLPLVLTPFANLAIGESAETIAKLVLSAQQKLSQFHHLPPICQQVARGSFSTFDPRLLSEIAQSYRIYPSIRMSVMQGTVALKRSAATEKPFVVSEMGDDNPTVTMANTRRGRAYVLRVTGLS
jgi:hypothetical protein